VILIKSILIKKSVYSGLIYWIRAPDLIHPIPNISEYLCRIFVNIRTLIYS